MLPHMSNLVHGKPLIVNLVSIMSHHTLLENIHSKRLTHTASTFLTFVQEDEQPWKNRTGLPKKNIPTSSGFEVLIVLIVLLQRRERWSAPRLLLGLFTLVSMRVLVRQYSPP